MNDIAGYIYIAEYVAPAFSAVSCAVLLLFSYRNSYTHTEVRIKLTAILYLCASGFSWLSTFIYIYFPHLFVVIQAPLYLALLYAQVLFYRLFHILTSLDDYENFSIWHYLIPAVICGTLLVWSLFVPYDIQLEIVEGRGKVIPEGYGTYTLFFTSKIWMRFLYCLIYMTLVFLRLGKYYRAINNSSNLVRKPAQWIKLLALLTIASIIVSTVGMLMRGAGLYRSMFAAIASAAIIAQHILMTYHIMQRGYLLYITFPGRKHVELRKDKGKPDSLRTDDPEPRERNDVRTVEKKRKAYSRDSGRILTPASFEAYFRKHKPYLDPSFRITDLVDRLDVNRSYLSGFVNSTYGVNFNRYVNRCRLQELDRLVKRPSHAGKPVTELVVRAGFSGLRHYHRVITAETAAGTTENENKE